MLKSLKKLLAREKYCLERFRDDEFECHCGCGLNEMSESFVKKLNVAAIEQGPDHPWIINSGMRCRAHNASKTVKGSPTSSHLKGVAADVQCADAEDRYEKILRCRMAGIRRIVVYDDKLIIHADDDKTKPAGLFVYRRKES